MAGRLVTLGRVLFALARRLKPAWTIAFYQLGYGIAAFGVGPLLDAGVRLPQIFAWAAVVALAMGLLSFPVTRRAA